jgi:hypothetical protein
MKKAVKIAAANLNLHCGDGKLHNHFTTSTKEKPMPLHNLSRRGHRSTNRQAN